MRLILIWDNLAGHYTPEMVDWCGSEASFFYIRLWAVPGSTWPKPFSASWYGARLCGQHPQSAEQIMEWLSATVRGWNADPTPFEWHGKRWQRRQRFRERHKLGGSRAFTRRPIRRRWQSKE